MVSYAYAIMSHAVLFSISSRATPLLIDRSRRGALVNTFCCYKTKNQQLAVGYVKDFVKTHICKLCRTSIARILEFFFCMKRRRPFFGTAIGIDTTNGDGVCIIAMSCTQYASSHFLGEPFCREKRTPWHISLP